MNPIYQPLPTSRSIRLLRIEPVSPENVNETVCCHLQVASLSQDPKYAALSYVWGDDINPTETINLDQCITNVTVNLSKAFSIFAPFQNYWIDALCINQADVIERNQQVAIMRGIYEKAVIVLVWLGSASDDSDIAIDFINNLRSDQPVWQGASEAVLRAVCNLFERPYWSRIWVIQEIILARQIFVFCGGRGLTWDRLTQFIQILARSIHYADYFREASGGGKPNDWKQKVEVLLCTQAIHLVLGRHYSKPIDNHAKGDLPLWHYINMFYTFRSTNPLDKVYGVLGMVPHDHSAFQIDYSLSVFELYARTLGHILDQKEEGTVELIYGRLENLSHKGPRLANINDKIDFALRLRRTLGLSLTIDTILPQFLPLEKLLMILLNESAPRHVESKNWTKFLKLEADLVEQESNNKRDGTSLLEIRRAEYLEDFVYDPNIGNG